MDGEISGKSNLHLAEKLFRRRNASGKTLALLLLNGGDGGDLISIVRKSFYGALESGVLWQYC